ncbi:MAG: hypothetical protein ACJA0A_000089 [Acidimicrobiales bacterium]
MVVVVVVVVVVVPTALRVAGAKVTVGGSPSNRPVTISNG